MPLKAEFFSSTLTISRGHVGNAEVPLASTQFRGEGTRIWMSLNNSLSLLPEGTSHVGINLEKVPMTDAREVVPGEVI